MAKDITNAIPKIQDSSDAIILSIHFVVIVLYGWLLLINYTTFVFTTDLAQAMHACDRSASASSFVAYVQLDTNNDLVLS